MSDYLGRKALITGVTGQDGIYLSSYLLGLGYRVFGLVRRTSHKPRLVAGVEAIEGDVTDLASLQAAVAKTDPDEIYNLAAQSHVQVSFDSPFVTAETNGIGAHSVFEASRLGRTDRRVYQAGTSEMFGGLVDLPYNEYCHFHPRSPYGCAKVYAHHTAIHYRERYGLHISNGILFNHESPHRGEMFVTRKITRALGRIHHGLQDWLILGNLDAKRDWGFAGDYVQAMHKMLQQDRPGDFVVATGETHSVREFLDTALEFSGVTMARVRLDGGQLRPLEVPVLRADPTKAHEVLKWNHRVGFRELVKMMVDSDLKLAASEAARGAK